jgi:hypothetical protein
MPRMRTRATFANVTALLALVVALGGSATAAVLITGKNVKDGSLSGVDVKNESLLSADIKNGSLQAKDFKAGVLQSGARGAQGLQGVAGPKGDQGAAGVTPETLPSGRTVRGGFSEDKYAPGAGAGIAATISFPLPLTAAPATNVVLPGGASTSQCPGSLGDPQAAPGQLCAYVESIDNLASPICLTSLSANTCGEANRFGASVQSSSSSATPIAIRLRGTWAVTAP